MHYLEVLKQSLQVLWHNKLLWIVGFIVALTTFPVMYIADWNDQWEAEQGTIIRTDENTLTFPGFDTTVDLAPNGVITIQPADGSEPAVIHTEGGLSIQLPKSFERDLRQAVEEIKVAMPADVTQVIVGSVVVVVLVVIGVIVVGMLLRYPAEAALISAVNDNAITKKKANWRKLLRMGWSRNAWRFFLIDVAVRLPLLVIFAILFILAVSPFVLSLSSDPNGWIIGFMASAVLLTGTIILAVITSILIDWFMHFFRRACAIEGLGVTAAIIRGMQLFFGNLKEIVGMTVLLWVVKIGWVALAVPLLVLMIPVFLVCVVLGGLAAMTVLFPTAGLASLFLNDVVAWVLGGSLALAVFLPIVVAPLTFLSGLLVVYQSSAWTLTYRELLVLEKAKAAAKSVATPVLAKA